MNKKKEVYVQPVLVTHELLRDITAKASGGYCADQTSGISFGQFFGYR